MGEIITDFPNFYIVFVREKCGYLSPPLLAPKIIEYPLKRDFHCCTMYNVHVQCTMYMYNVQCTMYMVSKGVSQDNPCIYLKFKDIGNSLTVSGY